MRPGLIAELAVYGRPILVVGAGPVGRRRAAQLLALGAQVTWIAPDAPAGHLQRCFQPQDCDGMDLVVACAPPAVNATVAAAAAARGILLCRADAPAAVRWLAQLERGALRIAISTGGRAPAAARAIRQALAARVPPEWGDLVERVAALRTRWAGRPERTRWLRAAITGPLAPVLESGRALDARAMTRWLSTIEASD